MVEESCVNESQKHDRNVHVNEIAKTCPKRRMLMTCESMSERCMLMNNKNMAEEAHVNESQKHGQKRCMLMNRKNMTEWCMLMKSQKHGQKRHMLMNRKNMTE